MTDPRELMDAHLDGELTPEQAAELAAWLEADPEHVKAFVRETHAHRQLRDALVARGMQAELAGTGASRSRSRLAALRPSSPGRFPPAAWLAVAAAVLVGLVALWGPSPARRERAPRRPPEAPAAAEEPVFVREELARLETERRRIRERLDVLERRRRDLEAADTGAAPDPALGIPGAPRESLTRIEADRQAVESEMAQVVEAMRRARAALAGAAPAAEPDAEPPAPSPFPVPAAPRETRAALATLDRAEGEVLLLDADGVRSLAASPRSLGPSQGLAVGAGAARAAVSLADGTRLELAAETELSRIEEGPSGRRVRIERGALAVEAARQPAGKPLVFETPHAEARVLGTAFTLEVHPESTALAVRAGRVRLVRRRDGAAADVGAGQHAAVAPGAVLEPFRSTPFVLGINFNGEAAVVEGRRWLSYREALARGLRVAPEPACTSTGVHPSPPVDDALQAMLNTAVFGQQRSLALAQPLPNGVYDVCFWVMENLADDYRAFDVAIEGQTRLKGIGPGMRRGAWVRLGPVRAAVSDGTLDVELIAKRTDPHLMGMAVYRADPR